MMRGLPIALVAALAGCSGVESAPSDENSTAAVAAVETVDSASAAEPTASTSAKGITLYLHDYTPSAGQLRTPRFAIQGDSATRAGEGNEWTLEGVRATVYDGEAEQLTLTAGHADFSEDENTATLSEGVRGQAGDVSFELEAIRYDNKTGKAESDGAVSLRQGETWIDAESVTIDPENELIHCRNFTGHIILNKEPS